MTFIFKKISATFLLLLLLPLTGLGCKAPSIEEQAAIRPVTINYWTVFGDANQLRKLAAQYQQLFPQVTINIRQIRYEEYDKLFTNALADDVGPDIISTHVRSLKKYQNRLSPMPARVTVAHSETKGTYVKETVIVSEQKTLPTVNSLKADYVTGVAEDAVLGGQIFGLPLGYDSLAIYYNKTLLDQAGIATPPTTWEELVAAVKQATKYDANNNIIQSGVALGTGKNIDNAADILALLVMQKNADMIRGNTVVFAHGLDKGFTTHPTVQSLRFYTDFARVDKEVYSWNKDLGSAFESFGRGKSVFYFGYAYDYARLKARNPQMTLESIPIPQLDPNKPVNIANYWVESVVKKSKNKDYAWDFIRFISLPNNIKAYSEAVKVPSPLRTHIGTQKTTPTLATFSNQSLTAKNWYRGREWETTKAAIQTMIDDSLLPLTGDQDTAERDSSLLIQAGRAVQQTM